MPNRNSTRVDQTIPENEQVTYEEMDGIDVYATAEARAETGLFKMMDRNANSSDGGPIRQSVPGPGLGGGGGGAGGNSNNPDTRAAHTVSDRVTVTTSGNVIHMESEQNNRNSQNAGPDMGGQGDKGKGRGRASGLGDYYEQGMIGDNGREERNRRAADQLELEGSGPGEGDHQFIALVRRTYLLIKIN
jgi:hypothetical protein